MHDRAKTLNKQLTTKFRSVHTYIVSYIFFFIQKCHNRKFMVKIHFFTFDCCAACAAAAALQENARNFAEPNPREKPRQCAQCMQLKYSAHFMLSYASAALDMLNLSLG